MTNTTENNKRIAKNTLLLYIRMLLTMPVSLYTSRIVLSTLGINDFGIYNVVGGFVTMFAVISGAMTTATQRFISFEIGKKENGNISMLFSTAVIIHLILGGIILFCAETIGLYFLNNYMNFPEDRYIAANWVYQFSVLTFIINVISVPYNAAIVAYEHMKAFAYVSIIEVTLKLLIVYLLIISPIDKLIFYSLLLAIIAITIRFIYGWYCKKHFKECHTTWIFNNEYGKKMFAFVGWNLIGSIARIAKEQGINVVLNIFFGAAINAARGIAYQVNGALNSFVSNFQLAMNPPIVKSYAASEKEAMFKLVFRGSKFSYLLLLTLSLPVFIETPFILNIWLEEVPEYTVIFLRLVLITSIIDSLSGTLIASMHASGKVRDYQIIVGGISLLTLPIVYVILKIGYAPYWAMIISAFMAIILLFSRLILLRRTIQLPIISFLKEVVSKITLVTLVSPILPGIVYYNMQIGWGAFFTVSFVSVISVTICNLYIGFNKEERNYILNKIPILQKIHRK